MSHVLYTRENSQKMLAQTNHNFVGSTVSCHLGAFIGILVIIVRVHMDKAQSCRKTAWETLVDSSHQM
jgi:hypothetical protein